MRSRMLLLVPVALLVFNSCGGGGATDAPSTNPGSEETAPFHAMPSDSVAVTGTATCVFSDDGVDPTGGDDTDKVTCELDMSDPRVSGTEIHDRFRYSWGPEDDAGMWIVEDAVIVNGEGTWRGTAQAVDDGTPIGEAHYVGEGAYEGLVFHYYFSDANIGEAVVHGWISTAG